VVAATHRDLRARVAERLFREDLYFRLSVFPIRIPPLRERSGDVEILARHFVDRYCREMKKPLLRLSPEAVEVLRTYPWPGNVRELQNCVERAVILCEGDTLHTRNLSLPEPADSASSSTPRDDPWTRIDLSGSLPDVLRRVTAEAERRSISAAVSATAGDPHRTAELLGVPVRFVQQKVKEFGLGSSRA
jgi:DNA-binding NtrC family response regulator